MGGISVKLWDFVRLSLSPLILVTNGYILTGTLFLKRFNDAFKMSTKQTDIFNQLSGTFTPAVIQKWESIIVTWEANRKAPNPYAEQESGKYILP